jgi:hypothetical protein
MIYLFKIYYGFKENRSNPIGIKLSEYRHLKVLKWASGQDILNVRPSLNCCPWGERTCRYAAKNGGSSAVAFQRSVALPHDGMRPSVHRTILRYYNGYV